MIKVSTSELKKAIKDLDSIVAGKVKINAMGGVLLTTVDNQLKLTTTDLKNTVTVTLDIQYGYIPNVVALGIKDILRSMKFFNDPTTEIEVKMETVNFTNDGKTIMADKLEASDFPKGDEIEELEYTYTYNEPDLYRRLKSVDYAKSKEDTRPMLTGVHFNHNDMVTIDGYRIAVDSDSDLYIHDPFTINPGVVKSLTRILNRKVIDNEITISTNDKVVYFKFGNTEIISKQLEGEFFDYKNTLSRDYTSINVNRLDFTRNINFLHVHSKGEMLEFELLENKLIITDRIVNKNTLSKVEMKIVNELLLIIGINSQYLVEALKQVKSDEIELQFTDNLSPIVIKDEDVSHLIIPIRLSK